MTDFTPMGRVPKGAIDALLDEFGSDEWIAIALRGPLRLALGACFLAMLGLAVHGYFTFVQHCETPQVLLGVLLVWPFLIAFATCEMRNLSKQRQREN
jgi:hypothetical protein